MSASPVKYLIPILLLLAGCPAPHDPPVTVNRGNGIEAISNQTVVIVTIGRTSDEFTHGTLVQRVLVTWLEENPGARILHMEIVGYNGNPHEIVLIVEGELGTE